MQAQNDPAEEVDVDELEAQFATNANANANDNGTKTHVMMNGNVLQLDGMDESELTNYALDDLTPAVTRRQSRFETYNKERTASFVAPLGGLDGMLTVEESAPVETGHMNVTKAHFDGVDASYGQDPQQKPGVIQRRQTRFEEYNKERTASFVVRGDQDATLPPQEASARRQSRFETYNKERSASFLARGQNDMLAPEETAPVRHGASNNHHHVTFTESTRSNPGHQETPDYAMPPMLTTGISGVSNASTLTNYAPPSGQKKPAGVFATQPRISNASTLNSNASTLTSHAASSGQEKPAGVFTINEGREPTNGHSHLMNDHSEYSSTSVATPEPVKGHPYLLDEQSEYSEAMTPVEGGELEDWVPDLLSPEVSKSRRFTNAVIDTEKDQMHSRVSGLTHFTGLDDFHYDEKSGYGFGKDTGGDGDEDTDIEDYVYGDDRRKSSMTLWVVMICLCLSLLAGVVPIVVCGFLGECSSESSNDVTSMDDATNATVSATINPNPPPVVINTVPPRPRPGGSNPNPNSSTINFVEIELGTSGATMDIPDYTLSKLDDPLSPQAHAYLWLVYTYSAEVLVALPMWRRQQVFALATFYFSFQGPRWDPVDQKEWLDPNVPECEWSTDIICYFEPEGAALKIPPPEGDDLGDSRMDLRGRVRAIRMFNFTAPIELADSMGVTGVPPEVELLQWMQVLELEGLRGLEDTSLEALLPLPELASLPFLWSLGTMATRMTGTLPTELGLLTELRFLKLYQNQFTGTLPSELGLMTDLQQVWLDNNDLTGTVPAPLCDLTAARDGLDLDIDCEEVTCPATGCSCDCAQAHQVNGGR